MRYHFGTDEPFFQRDFANCMALCKLAFYPPIRGRGLSLLNLRMWQIDTFYFVWHNDTWNSFTNTEEVP